MMCDAALAIGELMVVSEMPFRSLGILHLFNSTFSSKPIISSKSDNHVSLTKCTFHETVLTAVNCIHIL